MTQVYVYEWVDPVSDNYHTEGGLVIITDRDPQTVWNEQNLSTSDGVKPGTLPRPDAVYECTSEAAERVFTFPNSGCC